MSLKGAAIDTMDEYLGKKFCIPTYQREYSWEKDELDDFWEDLKTAVEDTDETNHFFGQVVVHDDEEHKKKFIIDGQQRTITSIILLRVLQMAFDEVYQSDNNIVEASYNRTDIEIKYIGRKGALHLVLGDSDKEYFQDNIQLGVPNSGNEAKPSHRRIKAAFDFFRDCVINLTSDISSNIQIFELLNNYYECFINRFVILYLEATKLDESFIIFETLNARGRDLETADLLKNYLFSKSGSNIEQTQQQWNSMISALDNADPTKYIRYFWNSRSQFTREKQLYKKISKEITTPKEAREFMDNLEKCSEYYQNIINPKSGNIFSDKVLISSLRALEILKAKSFYPVLLAMIQNNTFDETDYAKVASVIESYVFRNFTICGNVANKAEVFFAKLAKDIYGEIYSSSDEICEQIGAEMVSDKEFKDSFEIWIGKNSAKETIRYIFRKIHKYLDTVNEINIDNTEVHIEHIMPQDTKQWEIPEQEHTDYLWRLGNLTLLSSKLNKTISNKPFNEKKDEYKKSYIMTTNMLMEYHSWGAKEIEQRQQRLASYAVDIWSKQK